MIIVLAVLYVLIIGGASLFIVLHIAKSKSKKKDKGRITFLNTVDDQETVKKLNPERPEE